MCECPLKAGHSDVAIVTAVSTDAPKVSAQRTVETSIVQRSCARTVTLQ